MKYPKEPTKSAGVPRPGEPFQLDVGQRVPLTSSIEITLVDHEHKISEGAVDSPLGISLTLHRDGRDEPWDGWVELSGSREFTVAGVELQIVDYEYGRSMRLQIK